MKKNKGFTLIELLVVMAILGLLATLGLSNFNNVRIKGRDAQRKNDLNQIQKALELYYNDRGEYPGDETGYIVGCGGLDDPVPCGWGSPWQLGSTLYMKTLPNDPRTIYCYISGGNSYQLYAQLENTRDPSCFATPKSCAGNNYNYGVASSNISP